MDDFGTRIKNLRKEHKITQRALAEKAGVDFTYISKMENGKLENFPSVETILKLANILEANSDELILLAKKVPDAYRETIIDDDLAVEFLRKVPEMTLEQRNKMRAYLDGV